MSSDDNLTNADLANSMLLAWGEKEADRIHDKDHVGHLSPQEHLEAARTFALVSIAENLELLVYMLLKDDSEHQGV